MKISARNQIQGTIESVQEGAVNAVVTLKTNGGERITATITLAAVKELGLAAGIPAAAVVKATEVMIGLGELRLSARNQLTGEIAEVTQGSVSAVVVLKTSGGSILSATISNNAVKELGLAPGVKAVAVMKATSVMIGV